MSGETSVLSSAPDHGWLQPAVIPHSPWGNLVKIQHARLDETLWRCKGWLTYTSTQACKVQINACEGAVNHRSTAWSWACGRQLLVICLLITILWTHLLFWLFSQLLLSFLSFLAIYSQGSPATFWRGASHPSCCLTHPVAVFLPLSSALWSKCVSFSALSTYTTYAHVCARTCIYSRVALHNLRLIWCLYVRYPYNHTSAFVRCHHAICRLCKLLFPFCFTVAELEIYKHHFPSINGQSVGRICICTR